MGVDSSKIIVRLTRRFILPFSFHHRPISIRFALEKNDPPSSAYNRTTPLGSSPLPGHRIDSPDNRQTDSRKSPLISQSINPFSAYRPSRLTKPRGRSGRGFNYDVRPSVVAFSPTHFRSGRFSFDVNEIFSLSTFVRRIFVGV